MVRKSKRQDRRLRDRKIDERPDSEGDEADSVDSDMRIVATDAERVDDIQEKFGQRAINDEEGMKVRLKELQANFYNRLESAKLIKKQGKIPFTEHMTVTGDKAIEVPAELQVHDEIKREVAL